MKLRCAVAILMLMVALSTSFRVWADTSPVPVLDAQGYAELLRENKGKVILVDFWATWCGPCRKKLPSLKACRAAFPEDQLTVIGISLDFNPETLRSFLKVNQLSYPIYLADDNLAEELDVQAIPLLHIYDVAGNLRIVEEGLTPQETLCGNIDELMTPLP
ncbi:TlpA family protein disulfide reductase [Desulfonatronum thioautotrophicum]|uniref:TlpA family protein disulfide reductase n=1 Tax=Desulfonatronum thioautotrophicum TaxID=617001 RepID=UPI00137921C9|nr:TlpA disulfide reductase family protein [Desulfonatronum thioautotrophicum]